MQPAHEMETANADPARRLFSGKRFASLAKRRSLGRPWACPRRRCGGPGRQARAVLLPGWISDRGDRSAI